MIEMLSGIGMLLLVLVIFCLFSMKAPFGQKAMSGMADAAVASFLVEAVHKYILGDALGISFFLATGDISGSLGGVAAAILVPINMGVSPVFAVAAGLACGPFGILPGFIAGYVVWDAFYTVANVPYGSLLSLISDNAALHFHEC